MGSHSFMITTLGPCVKWPLCEHKICRGEWYGYRSVWESLLLKWTGGLRAISHMSQEPWPWNCESPKEKCPKAIPRHLQNHVVWSWIFKCIVKSYVTGPSTKCYFNDFYSCGSSRMIIYNKSMIVNIWSAMVPWFCVRPTSTRWFWKLNQVTMKNNPLKAM